MSRPQDCCVQVLLSGNGAATVSCSKEDDVCDLVFRASYAVPMVPRSCPALRIFLEDADGATAVSCSQLRMLTVPRPCPAIRIFLGDADCAMAMSRSQLRTLTVPWLCPALSCFLADADGATAMSRSQLSCLSQLCRGGIPFSGSV
ncbi:hypothetical protein F4604DRAFT_1676808 [Suillus subluteus]|nr:hypothetical protein F4604DRAFT_1676808 [Suillus subluteus]